MSDVNKYTLVEHLSELRKRIIIIISVFVIGSVVSFGYIQSIMDEFISIGNAHFDFIYISPPELLIAYMKLALIFGLLLASPIVFFQIWMFIKPGLENKSKKYLMVSLFFGLFFFFLGGLFSYTVVLPLALQFFGEMTIEGIQPMISIGNYIGFVTSIVFSFGIVFEMPMIIFILSKIGLITSSFLKKNRKYMVLVIFTLSAILTPPDILSQILLAIPMLILYEISIFISKFTEKK